MPAKTVLQDHLSAKNVTLDYASPLPPNDDEGLNVDHDILMLFIGFIFTEPLSSSSSSSSAPYASLLFSLRALPNNFNTSTEPIVFNATDELLSTTIKPELVEWKIFDYLAAEDLTVKNSPVLIPTEAKPASTTSEDVKVVRASSSRHVSAWLGRPWALSVLGVCGFLILATLYILVFLMVKACEGSLKKTNCCLAGTQLVALLWLHLSAALYTGSHRHFYVDCRD
ncbi:hypothetical protein AVEN_199158-1 [Araneus ventricosus]|uniref:Uncharacterized protein n=1 Tax=Araneus ventricosus TaxID=182803 RepID=A0A4Y2K113_ARAVE|nr:hypothetical protein AVEN_199158-1 [Araneus ventricosus]